MKGVSEEEDAFVWKRWTGGICGMREYNITREMYFAQNKKGRYLEG